LTVSSGAHLFCPAVEPDLYPLTVGLASWNAQASANGGAQVLYTLVVTGALVSIAPLIVAFLFLQRYWQSGLTFGSVKTRVAWPYASGNGTTRCSMMARVPASQRPCPRFVQFVISPAGCDQIVAIPRRSPHNFWRLGDVKRERGARPRRSTGDERKTIA
jgi:hypothetical protein